MCFCVSVRTCECVVEGGRERRGLKPALKHLLHSALLFFSSSFFFLSSSSTLENQQSASLDRRHAGAYHDVTGIAVPQTHTHSPLNHSHAPTD